MSAINFSGDFAALAGGLRVVPGAQPPQTLQSSRRNWAAQLAVGQSATALPGLLASVFNLCSHAHRVCAQLALDAAMPGVQPALPPLHVAQRLHTETAQEHIRRMGLDWPRLLAAPGADAHGVDGAAQAHAALQRCPLLTSAAHGTPSGDNGPWPATLAWLQAELLHMPATTWLAQWQAGGAGWLRDWAAGSTDWLAALLQGARLADVAAPVNPAMALRVHAAADADTDAVGMRELSAALDAQPGFALRPQWRGACAHTGNWARLHNLAIGQALTPWGLLGSRLAELAQLCLHGAHPPGEPAVLSFGAVPVGEGQGLAWVEMARGLLVHRVAVSNAQGRAKVVACDVVAPTEWNFHPHGVVAHCVAGLDVGEPADMIERRVRLLMAAFDPCVPFEVQPPQPTQTETSHA